MTQCSPKSGDKMQGDTPAADKAWRSQAPEAGEARKIQMGEFNVMSLDNGLTVIVVENHKLPRVSYSLSLKNDPIMENDKVGLVGMAGQLLGRGTKNKTKAEIDAAIDFIGASFNTSGSGMFGSSLTKHQDAVLEIMSDVLFNASFPKDEFDKILTQTLSGIEASKTDPNSMASNVAAVVNYGTEHPYGEVPTAETYNNISVKDCKQYVKRYFKANNAYLTIVGDITMEEAKMKAEKYFGNWSSGKVADVNYDTPEPSSEPRVCLANKDGAVQSVIRITYPVDNKPGNADATAATVMNSILGGGIFSGRLMQNLREDKAYTYGARSSLGSDPLVASFNASASVRTEVTDSSIVQFLYEMNRMVEEPVNDYDLMLSKNSLAGSFARSLESPQTLARFARNIQRYDLPEDYYETYLERLEAVSIEDVQRVAKKYIRPQNANIVVVGNKDEINEKLLEFDGDGEIEYFDAFGKKLEDVSSELPADLTAEVVINDYLNAIGGMDKIKAIKTLEIHMQMDMMGQKINIDQYYAEGDKFYSKVGNDQMVMQEMRFDGTTAQSGGMQGSQKATEGPLFDQAKSQSRAFDQLYYLSDGYMLELKGVDNLDGEACYKLSVKDPSGNETTEYYSIKSNLLMRELAVVEGPGGQQMTTTTDFLDYKEIDGIMFPHTIKTSGAMPMPIEMKATAVKVNPELDDKMFMIE
jgi:predicted Zn-dependent peptidase